MCIAHDLRASLSTQLVKNLSAMQETWVQSLGWEDPLEKEKATHFSILAWKILWTIQSMGLQRVRYNWLTFTFTLGKSGERQHFLKLSAGGASSNNSSNLHWACTKYQGRSWVLRLPRWMKESLPALKMLTSLISSTRNSSGGLKYAPQHTHSPTKFIGNRTVSVTTKYWHPETPLSHD